MISTEARKTFRKPEKICNQKQIDRLFSEGKSIRSGMFRLHYLLTDIPATPAVQLLIAVPKKNLRLAVTRNRMKRLIRESYRLHKQKVIEYFSAGNKHCDIAIVFTGQQCISQPETHAAINELLDRLIKTHEKNPQ
jgi:ribonuclease P protein component